MGLIVHPSVQAFGVLVLLWTCHTSVLGANVTSHLVLDFEPDQLTIVEGKTTNVTLNIRDNSTSQVLAERPWMASPGRLTVLSDTTYNLDVIEGTFEVSPCDFLEDKNYTITLKANNLGYASLQVFWEMLDDNQTVFNLSSCSSGMDEPTTVAQKMSSPAPETTTGVQQPRLRTTSTSTTTRSPLKNPVTLMESQENITESTAELSDDIQSHNETTDEGSNEESDDSVTYTDQINAATTEAEDEELDPESAEIQIDLEEIPTADEEVIESHNLLYEPEPQAPPQPPEDITTSSPEVPPEMPAKKTTEIKKKKDKKPKKFQVYKEGTTFLFKLSQELNVEEEAPIATKVLLSDNYRVKILRDAGTLDTVFVIVVSIAVVVNTLMMGMQINLAVVWGILKKPIGPAVGFFSQFAFMPLASYALGYLLLTDSNLRLGLFTLGCSPGGNGSNFWTLMLKGDLNLSITMTLISTTSALFMMPIWLFTLGQTIILEGQVGIPFRDLILSLFSFTIPVAIGVTIRRCKPAWANFAGKLIRPFTMVLIVVLLTLSILNSLYIFRLITWQMIVAGLSIAWGGYVFGAFMAWICRQKKPQIIAISIETAIQNPAITFMVLRLTLPQPDSDISAVAPVAQLLVTSTPLFLIFITVMIYRRCKACKSRKMEERLQEAALRDVDAADPLIVNRTSSVLPSNGTAKEKKELATMATSSSKGYSPTLHRRDTPPPPYPGVNMYSSLDDKDLERNADTTFAKTLASKQDSVDAVPLRKSEHIYENFRNGKPIEPLRESKL